MPPEREIAANSEPQKKLLRAFNREVQNYRKIQELRDYANQLTDAYNQASIRLAQLENKIQRMQDSASWRITAWLRALRRRFVRSPRPDTAAPSGTPLVICPVAAGEFQTPTTPLLDFQILSMLDQVGTDNKFVLTGWISSSAGLPLTAVRARIGEQIYTGKYLSADRSFQRLDFEIPLEINSDAHQFELDVEVENEWFLFHSVPLQGGKSRFSFETQPSMEANQSEYARWHELHDSLSTQQLTELRRRDAKLTRQPLISVVMPVYNTEERWLRRAIESVQNQVYPRWELCIADDASTQPHIRPLLEQFCAKDPRIKVVFRPTNGHISAASNSALNLTTGEFTCFLDHDDELRPHALSCFARAILEYPDAELIYSDEDKLDSAGRRFHPHFKPDWNPDLLKGQNYICHLLACRTSTLNRLAGFRPGVEGAQDWDLTLRLSEQIKPTQIHHIPRILYHWRANQGSTALQLGSKDYTMKAARKTLEDHLQRTSRQVTVHQAPGQHWHLKYSVPDPAPLVTLIIPTRNRRELLIRCIESILTKTAYPNFEFLIADNGSDDPELLAYYERQKARGHFQVLSCPGPFNFSAINNHAVKAARGVIIGLLNNDLETLHADWLQEMVGHAMRPGIGVVGAKLYYPDLRIQHAGIVTGLGGVAGHAFKKFMRNDPGTPQFRPHLAQNVTAVTAACAVMRKDVYIQAGGLDDQNLKVAFNDVDFCLRVEALGYRNVYTPFAELIHHESASRGSEYAPGKLQRFAGEIEYMKVRWGERLLNDPAYNPNLTVEAENFSFAFPPRHEKA